MARYDKDFKLKCIKAYEDGKPLPEIEGVLPRASVFIVPSGETRTSLKKYILDLQKFKGDTFL